MAESAETWAKKGAQDAKEEVEPILLFDCNVKMKKNSPFFPYHER
jgi:hypothetical protein